MLYGIRYGFDMDILDSGNENKTKLIRFGPIKISTGTSRGANADS
jgi:hypothetical protein